MDTAEFRRFYYLITASVDGDITAEQFAELKQTLRTNPAAVRCYLDYMSILSGIRSSEYFANDRSGQRLLDEQLWDLLSEYEKTAPAIAAPVRTLEKVIVQKVERPAIRRQITTGTIVSAAAAIAAIIFFVLFAYLVPPKTGFEVATLSDAINARFHDRAASLQTGARLVTGTQDLLLREGMIKINFDNEARVTIEGPAEFQIPAEDQIKLNYGKLYATVPQSAIGFVINTPSARVIDLGTEFGIEADTHGNTSLHVIKGKTTLIAGRRSDKISKEVVGGIAQKVAYDTRMVSEIPCEERLFVRDIDSANDLVLRGEAVPKDGYMNWVAQSGNWADPANWDTGAKPDGRRSIMLRKNSTSVCTLNTAEVPVSSTFTATGGQTLNIETGGYFGCGWARFAQSVVNMTGNGTWLLNDDDLYIGYPYKPNCLCVWTMYDRSVIDINEDGDDGEVLYISQDDAKGTLKLVGSNITVNCDQLYVGFSKKAGYSPDATLEYEMDAGGASTIHVGYRIHLSEGGAVSRLVLKAPVSLPQKDLVLIETKSSDPIAGDGVFSTLNDGQAAEGTSVALGGNRYTLTYQYDANNDGCRNDIALILERDLK